MKLRALLTLATTSVTLGIAAQGATVTWDNGGAGNNWYAAGNWDIAGSPNLDGTDNAVITSAGTVSHNSPPADFDPHAGSTVSITSSTVEQTTTHWQRMSGGTLTLDNSTWTTASNVRLAYDSGVNAGTINLLNGSSYTAANEFWVTRNDTDWTNVNFDLNISGGSSMDLNGTVGLWFWDAEETGNDYNVNFTGPGTIEGRIGYQSAGGSTNNSMTWEALWTAGVLQWNGSNAGTFGDHFSTTGASNTTSYTLIAIPEPSSAALLGLGGLALALRRRK